MPNNISCRNIYTTINNIQGQTNDPGLLDSAPAGTIMGFTDTGYMWVKKYIEHFINSIPPAHPVLLILDGHKSYVNYTCVNFCYKNNSLFYALSPHTTHVLQPAELPFAYLKKAYSSECDKYHMNSSGKLVTKYTFAKLFGQAYIKAFIPLQYVILSRQQGYGP